MFFILKTVTRWDKILTQLHSNYFILGWNLPYNQPLTLNLFCHLKEDTANYLLWGFSKEIKSMIILNSYRLIYLQEFLLFRVFHWYFSVSFIGIFQSIELASYCKNCNFIQFVTIYNFICYKCGRSAELQKSANETLYVYTHISPTIFLEAKCPIYSSTH